MVKINPLLIIHALLLALLVTLLFALPVQAADEPRISLKLSKERVWQREQVIITLEVFSNNKLARLEADDFEQSGFKVTPLELQRFEEAGAVRLVQKWIVFPFVSEQQLLQLPRVRYRPSSGRPVELQLPKLYLTIQPLPIYVPPTMPVGKVELKNKWQNSWLLTQKKLYEWQVNAVLTQVSPQTPAAISRQLTSDKNTQILPIKQAINSIKNEDGLVHQQSYDIPFKANIMGVLALPDVEIQYFDPEIGKLQKTQIERPFALVISPWLSWLLLVLLGGILVFSAQWVLPKLKSFYKRRKYKKQALEALASARDYQQVRTALKEYSKSIGLQTNTTLEQFALGFAADRQLQLNLSDLLNKLKESKFSTNSSNANDESIKFISGDLYKILSRH